MPELVEWRSMESAPTDGTEILLYALGDIGVCYWRNDERMVGWTWGLLKQFKEPTHWMPLPKDPTVIADIQAEFKPAHIKS